MTSNEKKLLRFAVARNGVDGEQLDRISGQINLDKRKIIDSLPTIEIKHKKTGPKPKYEAKVKAMLQDNPNITTAEIVRVTGCRRETAWRILKRLEAQCN